MATDGSCVAGCACSAALALGLDRWDRCRGVEEGAGCAACVAWAACAEDTLGMADNAGTSVAGTEHAGVGIAAGMAVSMVSVLGMRCVYDMACAAQRMEEGEEPGASSFPCAWRIRTPLQAGRVGSSLFLSLIRSYTR